MILQQIDIHILRSCGLGYRKLAITSKNLILDLVYWFLSTATRKKNDNIHQIGLKINAAIIYYVLLLFIHYFSIQNFKTY